MIRVILNNRKTKKKIVGKDKTYLFKIQRARKVERPRVLKARPKKKNKSKIKIFNILNSNFILYKYNINRNIILHKYNTSNIYIYL